MALKAWFWVLAALDDSLRNRVAGQTGGVVNVELLHEVLPPPLLCVLSLNVQELAPVLPRYR
jgi:hypothetical protein